VIALASRRGSRITGVPTFRIRRQYTISGAQSRDLRRVYQVADCRRVPRQASVNDGELTGRAPHPHRRVPEPAVALTGMVVAPFVNARASPGDGFDPVPPKQFSATLRGNSRSGMENSSGESRC